MCHFLLLVQGTEGKNIVILLQRSAVSHDVGSTWVSVFCMRVTGQGWGVVGLRAGGDIIAAAVAGLIGY